MGPFLVDTHTNVNAARDALTRLEQARWVLGGLLEEKDLRSTWPIRLILTESAPQSCEFVSQKAASFGFVSQNNPFEPAVLHAQYLLVCQPGAPLPLGEIAGLLLDANTPRLPADVEAGMRSLFNTLEAHGSRAFWSGAPPQPDLAWARMHLFATKFEYSASFHIFLSALRSGSTVRAAEQNAFGQPSDELEHEAAAHLAARHWGIIATSGRPLDPNRDFGSHSMEASVVNIYLADASLSAHRQDAMAAYQAGIESGSAAALGHEGLAQVARTRRNNPDSDLENAMHAGSRSAPVYLASSSDLPPEQALALCRKAALLNPLWAAPIAREAELTEDRNERETLLKKATALDRRDSSLWIALAEVQAAAGHAAAAQGSWLRAEDAAPNDELRDKIHQQRQDSEAGRVEAIAKAREREQNKAYYADLNAQQRASARIGAAEKKANQALTAEGSGTGTEDAIPWQDLAAARKIEGALIRVECLPAGSRITVKEKTGANLVLSVKDLSEPSLSCGEQRPPRRVSLTYLPSADGEAGISGTVASLSLWHSR